MKGHLQKKLSELFSLELLTEEELVSIQTAVCSLMISVVFLQKFKITGEKKKERGGEERRGEARRGEERIKRTKELYSL